MSRNDRGTHDRLGPGAGRVRTDSGLCRSDANADRSSVDNRVLGTEHRPTRRRRRGLAADGRDGGGCACRTEAARDRADLMIELQSVHLRAGDFTLSNLSFKVEAGQYAVLMGRTGRGKTTILESICGLRKIDAGKILIHGTDVTDWPPGGSRNRLRPSRPRAVSRR